MAKVLGPFTTVKLVYPVLASLAALPAYLLIRKCPMPVLGVISILALPDLMVKSLTGTPQGLALPLFLLALYFVLQGRRLPFVAAATAVLLTHHLTGLIVLVLYFTVWVLPRSPGPGFLKKEWPFLLYFASWPLYWAWTFSNTEQSYMAPILLVLAAGIGLPLAAILYAALPYMRRAVSWLQGYSEWWRGATVAVFAETIAGLTWVRGDLLFSSPGLSTSSVASQATMSIYAAILVIGLVATVSRRHTPLTMFMVTLLILGMVTLLLGCQHVFDGLRVADYALIGGLVALFAPGKKAGWARRGVLIAVALLVVTAGFLRFQSGYDRLFANTSGEIQAAEWLAANAPEDVTVATDTKMSLLVLGEGNRNATFEGTWWLFSEWPIAPYINALNRNHRFDDRPIRYVLLSDYMFHRGADIGWFTPTLKVSSSLPSRLDGVGQRAYEHGGVTIWKVDHAKEVAVSESETQVDFISGLKGVVAHGPCR